MARASSSAGRAEDWRAHALGAIAAAEFRRAPYPHLVVDGVWPARFYEEAHAELTQTEGDWAFQRGHPWPYVTVGKRGIDDVRMTKGATHSYKHQGCSLLRQMEEFVKSQPFMDVLLDKFGGPTTADGLRAAEIPKEKLAMIRGGVKNGGACAGGASSVRHEWHKVMAGVELAKDLPGYEFPPHADKADKVVTFLFYMTQDLSLKEKGCGTYFCTLKGDASNMELEPGYADSAFFGWENFDNVEVPMIPNRFVAFAPNTRTFHAVKVQASASKSSGPRPTLAETPDRLIFRGFIRTAEAVVKREAGTKLLAQSPGTSMLVRLAERCPRLFLYGKKKPQSFSHVLRFIMERVLLSDSHLVDRSRKMTRWKARTDWRRAADVPEPVDAPNPKHKAPMSLCKVFCKAVRIAGGRN